MLGCRSPIQSVEVCLCTRHKDPLRRGVYGACGKPGNILITCDSPPILWKCLLNYFAAGYCIHTCPEIRPAFQARYGPV